MSYLTLLVQKGHTWKKFSSTERWLLIQALLLLPVVAILLQFGAKRTHFLLSIFLPSKLSLLHPTSQILTTANMVKVAAKYYSWATCLRRAFVLWFLLRRQGIGAELKIGTRLATEFQAHAWVEYQGFVVGERQATKQHYVAFDKLETKLSQNRLTRSVSWRLEDELLLCCAKTSIDTATAARVNKLLQSDKKIDWEYLLQQACQHGVFLLLHQNLITSHSEYIPKNIQPHLQAYCHTKTARNLFLSKKLCQILEFFKNNDIQVIPFKGSVLAASTYKNLALREFCDIDLLIEEANFPKVKEILLSQGYQVRTELQHWGQDFTSKDDKIHIDIHWQLAPSCFPYKLDFQQLWLRRSSVSILNQQVTNLSPEDLLLILCVQMVKDANLRKEKLNKICDIAELIRTSELDWELVIQQSQNMGSERLLIFGLALARELLEVELPSQINQKIATSIIVHWYTKSVIKQLFNNKQEQVFGIFQQGLIQGLYAFLLRGLMIVDSSNMLGKHNRYLVKHLPSLIISPNSRDLEFISIPRYLHFLYYLVRPVRLGFKFFHRLNKTNP